MYPGTWSLPVMRDVDEETADGHSEVDDQGENDEHDSDCPQNPEEDNSCPGLWFLVLGFLEVFQRRLVHGRPEVTFISHKRHLFSQEFRRVGLSRRRQRAM